MYKNTEQWLNQQMVDSQREITTNQAGTTIKVNSDQNSAKHLMNEFLNNQ